MDKEDLINDILYQMGALQAICRVEGVEITHVKPHGALDDMAAQDRDIAAAIVEAVGLFDDRLPIYTVWNAETRRLAERAGIPTVLQVYVDRGVTDEGVEIAGYHLDNVGGSIEAALSRVITAVKTGKLASENGRLLDWEANSVCFHGDGADALSYATRLPAMLGKQACPSRCLMPAPPAEGLRLSWCGESYVSIRLFDHVDIWSVAGVLRLQRQLAESDIADVIIAMVPGWTTLLLWLDADAADPAAVEEAIGTAASAGAQRAVEFESRIITLPTVYAPDAGPDLEFVAKVNGLTVPDTVERLQAAQFAGMVSFSPGMANCMWVDSSRALTAPKYCSPRPPRRPARSGWADRASACTRSRPPADSRWSARWRCRFTSRGRPCPRSATAPPCSIPATGSCLRPSTRTPRP